jgi:hypothetical protein
MAVTTLLPLVVVPLSLASAIYWSRLENTVELSVLNPAILFLPFYVPIFYLRTDSDTATTTRHRVAATVAIAGGVTVLGAGVLAPPDPFTQVRYAVFALPVGAVVGYVLTSSVDYFTVG